MIGVTCLLGGAAKAQTRDTSQALPCQYDDGGLQALCELGKRSRPEGASDYLPALDEFAIALSVYGRSRGAHGARPGLAQLRDHLVEAVPEFKTRVDALVELSQARGDKAQFRGQLIQVLLCPYVLDHGLANTQKVCGDAGPTPADVTRRGEIVQAINAYYATKGSKQPCNTPKEDPICVEVESLPLNTYDILRDWLPALDAEARRQERCQSADPADCALALLDAAQVTAAALAADELLAQWLPGGGAPGSTRCLASLATKIPGTGSSVDSAQGFPRLLPDVSSLWANPDQTARRALETRLSQWRSKGRALADAPHAISQLSDECLRSAITEVVAAVPGASVKVSSDAPRFDAAGHIVVFPFSSEHGFHDFASQGDGPLAALRVRFSALRRDDCPPDGVVGSLSLIGRYRDSANAWQGLEVAVGVEEIRFTAMCHGNLAFSSHQISPEQLRQSLGKLLPPPLRLVDAAAKLHFQPGATGPGRLTLTVTAHVGITGSDDAEEVTWDIGAGGTSLDAAMLMAKVKPVLERRLAPVLGDAVSSAGLYLAPPEGCGPDGAPSQMRGIRLYACLRLPSSMGLPNDLPAVLTTIDIDPQGKIQIMPSRGGLAAVQDALTGVLADKVGEWSGKLGVNQTILSRFQAEPTLDGIRLQLALQLDIDGTTVPWQLTLNVPYRGGTSLEDQILAQRPTADALVSIARNAADRAVAEVLDKALARLSLPGIRITDRNIAKRSIVLELSLPIPGFEPQTIPIDLRNPGNLDSTLQAALRSAIQKALSPIPEVTLAGVTMKQVHLLKDRWALGAVAVLYKDVTVGVTVPLDGRFIPEFDAKSISASAVAAMLNGALGDSIKTLTDGKIGASFEMIDGLPTVRISGEIDLTLVGPLSLAGQLNARISQRNHLVVERLRLECKGACWVTLGEFEIGDFSIAVDLPKPKNFAIGAKLALTPGAQTEKMLRLQAELTVDNPIRIDGSLQLLHSANLGTFNGMLDPGGERMHVRGAIQLPVLEIPLGSVEIELDGKRCLLSGKGSQSFLGIGDVSIDTRLKFGKCKGSEHSDSAMAPPAPGICHAVERSDVSVCGEGRGSVLEQEVILAAAMSLLPLRAPVAQARINILGIDLDTEIRRNTVRLRGSLGGIAKITLLLPALGTLKPKYVEGLLAQLLKPKFDWDAIRRRDITVSLIPSSSSSPSDSDSETLEQASSVSDAAARQAILTSSQAGNANPPFATGRVQMSTTYTSGPSLSLDCSAKAERLYAGAGAGSRWWGVSREVCGIKQPLLLDANQLVYGLTTLAIFCEQEGVGCKADTLKVTQAIEGKDASAIPARPINLSPVVRDALWKPWTYEGNNSLIGVLLALANDPSLESGLQAACVYRGFLPNGPCLDAVAIVHGTTGRFAFGDRLGLYESSLLWMVINHDPKDPRIPSNLEAFLASNSKVAMVGSGGGSIFVLLGEVSGPPRNFLKIQRLSFDDQGALRLGDTPVSASFSNARLPITAIGGWFIDRTIGEQRLIAHIGGTIKNDAVCSISLSGISYCSFVPDHPGVVYAYVHDSTLGSIVERSESCLQREVDFWVRNDMLMPRTTASSNWSQSAEFLQRIQAAADEWVDPLPTFTSSSFRSNPRLLITNPPTPCEAKL